MIQPRNVCAWLVASAFICGTAHAAVDLSTSELIKVSGKVEVKKGQEPAFKSVPANLKLAGALKRLDGGDKVKTSTQSSAELALKNTCVLAVKEGSLFEVPLTLGQAALTKLKAQQGSFLFKVVSGSDFKVQTADVIAGVKGTLFEVEIHDNIVPLLLTPGLELGVAGAGGTVVNVFEGDVELTHALTGKTRKLKAGERLAAFGSQIMQLDKSLAEGFGQVSAFQPLQRLQERFGSLGMRLGAVPSTVLGIAGVNTEGAMMPVSLGRAKDRLNSLTEGISAPIMEKLRQIDTVKSAIGGIKDTANEAKKTIDDLKGQEFKPTIDEGKYPVQVGPLVVPENGLYEAHLGHGQFLAIGPEAGCQAMKLQPERGGLMLQEGVGTIKLKNPVTGIDGTLAVKTVGNHLLHLVQMKSGTLLARIPGETAAISVTPSQPLAIEFDPAAGTGRKVAWPQDPAFNKNVVEYRLTAETDIEAQRAQHDAKVSEARGNAIQKVLQKAPKIKLPKFRFP
ncbi:MAG TPA: FecR family protein [Candidatus Ozemobacteraceae bacterium]|nr:FecR family protein [Candidatus Ozemobacteraceae bacterium]